MARGQMVPNSGTKRGSGHVRALDPDRPEELGRLVGVRLGPVGARRLSLSPDPGRSTEMQVKCSVYSGS
jgi:hypothetical protein